MFVDYFDSPLYDLLLNIAKLLSKHSVLKKALLILSGILEATSVGLIICSRFLDNAYRDILFNVGGVSCLFCGIILVIAIMSYFPDALEKASISEKLKIIENKRTELENNIKKSNGENVQEIIKLNLNQLDEYYTINKNQSKNSYNVSVFMIIIGFVLIAVTVIVFYMHRDKYTLSIITGLTGLISEFIGATSLLLYKESIKNVNEFIERLSYLQKVMLAIDLAEKLPRKKRDKQISKIIDGLIGIRNEVEEKLMIEKAP